MADRPQNTSVLQDNNHKHFSNILTAIIILIGICAFVIAIYVGERQNSDELRQNIEELRKELMNLKSQITTQSESVAFYAQLTTDKSGIKNHETLTFDKVMINLGNAYNGMSGVFTAPTAGLYAFHWTNTNADRSYMNTELIVQNQVYGKAMSDAMDHDDYAVASNLAIAQLNRGDQVWVRSGTWHSGKLRGDLYSTFSGYRIQ